MEVIKIFFINIFLSYKNLPFAKGTFLSRKEASFRTLATPRHMQPDYIQRRLKPGTAPVHLKPLSGGVRM